MFGPRAEFLPLLGLLDPEWVVGDLGVGTGGLAETLSPYVRAVIGVDRSEAMLSAARDRLAATDNVRLQVGELESLPLADGELDLAVFNLVLHYVVEPRLALREAYRALRPGGHLIIVDMRRHERGPKYAEEMGHVWPGFGTVELEGWLHESGFGRVSTRPLPPDPKAQGPLLLMATAEKP